MTTQGIPGSKLATFPPIDLSNVAAAIATATALSAAGHQYSMAGTMTSSAAPGTTEQISEIHFAPGASIVSAGGTSLTVGIQGVATGATSPHRVDGTYKSSGAAWQTALLSALTPSTDNFVTIPGGSEPSVVVGTDIGVMFELSGFAGADSVALNAIGNGTFHNALFSRNPNTGTFAPIAGCSNVSFKFLSGRWGTLHGAMPFSTLSNVNVSTGSGQRQVGLAINLPFPIRIYGFWVFQKMTANAAGTVSLFTDPYAAGSGPAIPNGGGAGAAMTYTYDVARGNAISSFTLREEFFPDYYDLAANTDLVVAFDSNTANAISMVYLDEANAGQLDALAGQNQFYVQRNAATSGTAFAKTMTRFPFMGLLIGGFSDGAGGGGSGMLYLPDLAGT